MASAPPFFPPLHAVYFRESSTARGLTSYDALTLALRCSLSINSPCTRFVLHKQRRQAVAPPAIQASENARRSFLDNTDKMRRWWDIIHDLPMGERIILADCDMLCLASLEWPAIMDGSDIGITVRPPDFPFPFNSGVVLVRKSDASQHFFDVWREHNERMLADATEHAQFRQRYGGINQAALGAALESVPEIDATCARLPCQVWNAEESAWGNITEATKLLHLKGAMRRCLENSTLPRERKLLHGWALFHRYRVMGATQ